MNTKVEKIKLLIEGISDFSDVESDVGKFRKVLNELSLPKELKTSFKNTFSELENEAKNYQRILNSGFKTKKDITGLEESGKEIKGLMSDLLKSLGKIKGEDLKNSLDFDEGELKKAREEVEKIKKELSGLDKTAFNNASKSLKDSFKELSKMSKAGVVKDLGIKINAGDFQGTLDQIKEIESYLRSNPFKEGKYDLGGGKYDEFKKQLEAIKNTISTLANDPVTNLKNQLAQADARLADLTTEEVNTLIKVFDLLVDKTEEAKRSIEDNQRATEDMGRAQKSLNDEVENIKNGITHFFSLSNAANMFKSAVHNAFKTVQELDKIMTETAVVTDFSVSDMWDQLPQYTEMANELGVAIADVYSASTLYYQQGLKTNEVMDITTETLKMARIASIDASKATNYMTAALRGFNMEIDEMNAQRINDVYSELAAITAADTGQIATAMTKTASIAASANMEFESTAALLSQIIETTQEAPETAGTALKTIIARFSEVKKLQSEGKNEGTDEEGEAINVNNIDKALKSVGISMDAFFAGTEGLDDVLFRLAEKWKTLDFETQRYIATTAAGSRQQSRFIAMMSDYERTMELVGAANDSAGASQRQFNKTTESLESKLNRLKNAWDQFLMGIANSDIIKGIVDIVTFLVESLNGLINTISGGNGALKSVTSLATAIIGLWGGSKLANAAIGTFASTLLKGMPVAKQFAKEGKEMPKIFKEFKDEITDLPGLLNIMKDGFKGAKGDLGGIKGILSGLKGGIKDAFTAAPVLSWTLAIGAAFGALKLFTWVYDTWFNQEKIMQRRMEQSQAAADKLKQEYDELKISISSIDAKDAELDELAVGTQEWKDKVHELNEEVKTLIEQYPELAKFAKMDSTGKLYLTEGYEDVINQQKLNVERANNASMAAQADYAQYQADNFLKNADSFYVSDIYGNQRNVEFKEGTDLDEFYTKVASLNPLDYQNELKQLLQEYTYANEEVLGGMDLASIFSGAQQYVGYKEEAANKTNAASAFMGLTEEQYREAQQVGKDYITNQGGLSDALVKNLLGNDHRVDGDNILNAAGEVIYDGKNKEDTESWLANYAADKQYVDFSGLETIGTKNALTSFNNGQYNSLNTVQQDTALAAINQISGLTREGKAGGINNEELEKLLNLIKEGGDVQGFVDSLISVQEESNSIEENIKEVQKVTKNWGTIGEEAAKKQAEAWEKDQEEIKNLQKTLKDGTKGEKIESVAEVFNVSNGEAARMLEQYPEEFKKIQEGGEGAAEAFNKIQTQVRNKAVSNFLTDNADKADDLNLILSDIDGKDLEVGGTADFTEIFTQLTALMGSAEEAAAFLESLGYTITWQYKYPGFPPIIHNPDGSTTINPAKIVVTKTGIKEEKTPKTPPNNKPSDGGSKDKNWENPYDKFYNITEKINEELRTREKLERKYDRILKARKTTAEELKKITLDQIASLRKENDLQQQIANGRLSQIKNLGSETYVGENGKTKTFSQLGVTKYASYNSSTGTLSIDWNGLEKIKDTEFGEAVEAYITKLQNYAESYEEAIDTIETNTDEIVEIQERSAENYLELEERVYSALVEERQKQIDALQQASEAIIDSNSSIIDSLQESIDLERQIRDNTKKEEDINEKEARLAYLRRDTSSGNALEIARLEEELANDRESYGDSLIDQEIQRLVEENERAAEQRERQIAIMEAQLEHDEKMGVFWAEVEQLIQEAIESEDPEMTAMVNLLKDSEAFKGMSYFGKMQWIDEMIDAFAQSELGLGALKLKEAKSEGSVTQNGMTYTYSSSDNKWYDSKKNAYEGSYDANKGELVFTKLSSKPSSSSTSSSTSSTSTATYYKKVSSSYNSIVDALKSIGVNGSYSTREKIAKKNGISNYSGTPAQNVQLLNLLKQGKLKKYALGGIADFTGPAWLDGTKSKPELILSAKDTQNFIALKDILASLMGGEGSKAQSTGDNYFDIHINVDELGSDYDVDQLVTRIKQKIYEDSSYRNVNTINFIR